MIVSLFLTIYLVVIALPQDTILFALLISTLLYILHEVDEYVFPGGFDRFMNRNVFKTDPEADLLDSAAVFWINMIVWIAIPLFSLWAIVDITQATAIPYFFIFQAVIHLILGIVGKHFFNPGMVSEWLIHILCGTWTIWLLAQAGVVTNPAWNPGLRDGLLIVLAILLANRVLVARYKRRQQQRSS